MLKDGVCNEEWSGRVNVFRAQYRGEVLGTQAILIYGLYLQDMLVGYELVGQHGG